PTSAIDVPAARTCSASTCTSDTPASSSWLLLRDHLWGDYVGSAMSGMGRTPHPSRGGSAVCPGACAARQYARVRARLGGGGGRLADVTTQVIAHRGNSSVAPENTMAAFESAWRAGADVIELDIQLS